MARSSDSAVERVLNQQEVTEAARLARHKRLAAADKATSSPAKSKPAKPLKRPATAVLAARVWEEVTDGAGAVLVDGQPLHIPRFGEGGGKP